MNPKSGTIVYIGGMEMPDRNAAAHRVLNNAKIFRDLGYEVVFCGVDKSIAKDCDEAINAAGFESYPSRYPASGAEWVRQLFDFRHTEKILNRYDDLKFAVAYNMHAKPLSQLLKYCKKRKIKVIADITEWYENRFSFHPVKLIKWYDTRKVMRNLHKKVGGIISISAYLTDYYQKSIGNIVQIPPLVDESDVLWRQAKSAKNNVVEFVYTGNPGRDVKDKLQVITEAFAKLPETSDFLFHVLGVTKQQFLEDYPESDQTVTKLGQKLVFHGRVSHFESIGALMSCDYCVFIRGKTRKNTAGFPTKFAECVTSGIGVIANDISNIRDYFPLAHSQLLENDDPDSILSALEIAIRNGKVDHIRSDAFDYRNYIREMDQFLLDVGKID